MIFLQVFLWLMLYESERIILPAIKMYWLVKTTLRKSNPSY